MSKDTAARALLRLMEDLSEECWCAGWITGLDYALWRLAIEGGGRYGQGTVTAENASDLLELAEAAGCWWIWSSAKCEEEQVPLEEWRQKQALDTTAAKM